MCWDGGFIEGRPCPSMATIITDANYMQSIQIPVCDHGAPIFGTGYNVPVAGSSVGMAITHGRVLGRHLAAL